MLITLKRKKNCYSMVTSIIFFLSLNENRSIRWYIITLHAHARAGYYVIGASVYMYVGIYFCGQKKV